MKIAYLTMAYDLKMTCSLAIPGCVDQSWRDKDKVLYLMYQEPFPVHIGQDHHLDIAIREFNVHGIQGFGWWLLKLAKFLEVCEEEYMLQWDEDDYYPHNHTPEALWPLMQGAVMSWSLTNYEVKRGSIFERRYTSGMGTLCARVDALRQPVLELLEKYPDGQLRVRKGTREPCDATYKGEWEYCGGALDAHLKKMLVRMYGGRIAEHNGRRFMTFHSKTNTKGGRKPEENIDYA